jgi:hypothetical protein
LWKLDKHEGTGSAFVIFKTEEGSKKFLGNFSQLQMQQDAL